jgi:hypothetical protein
MDDLSETNNRLDDLQGMAKTMEARIGEIILGRLRVDTGVSLLAIAQTVLLALILWKLW